jgi:hypothetical protein
VKHSFLFYAAGFVTVIALSGCGIQPLATPSSAPPAQQSLNQGPTTTADRTDRATQERARIAALEAAAKAQQIADEQAAAEVQRIADEEAARIAVEQEAQQDSGEVASGAFTREDVAGTILSMSGLPLAVVFDATWCNPNAYVCGGVYTRAPRAPSTVAELTIHMSDSPAWLYAKVGYIVTVHEIGHALTAYYQPQILAAFGLPFLDSNIEKIADCYLILHVGGSVGTSGYSFDGLESEIAQWMVNNL